MGSKQRIILRSSLVAVLVLAVGLGGPIWGRSNSGGATEVEGAAEPAKGPNGGWLLEAGELAVEVTIFERNVPPDFRVYAFDTGAPLAPPPAGGDLLLGASWEYIEQDQPRIGTHRASVKERTSSDHDG